MKKKIIVIIAIFIVSIMALILINTKDTYSQFTTTATTELSLDFIAEPTYTFYFQMPPDWHESAMYCYMWGYLDDGTEVENAEYPGVKMTEVNAELKIFSYTLSTDLAYKTYGKNPFKNIIFTDTNADVSTENRKETVDLKVTADINGKIFVPELYKQKNSNELRVISNGYSPCYIYAWNEDVYPKIEEFGTWPGKFLGSTEGDEHYASAGTYWEIINTQKSHKLIFHSDISGDQTEDLPLPPYQDLTYRKDLSKWKRTYYMGSWHTYSNWTKSEYNTWKTTDYVTFQQSAAAGY